MKWQNPETSIGFGRCHPITALVLGGALLVSGGLAGCQKNDGDTARTEPPVASDDVYRGDAEPMTSSDTTLQASTLPEALKAKPTNAELKETYAMGMTAYRERRYEDARAFFQIHVDEKPERSFPRTMLGLAAWKSGDPATAELEFEVALKADPENDRARFNLARVFLETKRPRQALDLVSSRRENAEAMRLTGRAHHQAGRAEEALSAYRMALVLDDQDAWSMNNMALIQIEQEHFEEALAPLARAIELNGGVAVFHNNLGVALERTGSFAASAEQYAAALRLDGSQDHAEVSRQRVTALAPMGKPAPDLALLADQFENTIDAWRSSEMAGREDDRK